MFGLCSGGGVSVKVDPLYADVHFAYDLAGHALHGVFDAALYGAADRLNIRAAFHTQIDVNTHTAVEVKHTNRFSPHSLLRRREIRSGVLGTKRLRPPRLSRH